MHTGFDICLLDREHRILGVALREFHGANAYEQFLTLIRETLADGAVSLVLDLTGLEYIDSKGLGTLVWAAQQASRQGGAVALAAPQEAVRDVHRRSGASPLLRVYDGVPEAVAALSSLA